MTTPKYPPVWLTWIVACANVLAIADLPYSYYQLLRLVVTGYAAYLAYICFKKELPVWAWGFTFIALLYNPVFIIEMTKGQHALHNLPVALAIIAELKIARRIVGDTDRHDLKVKAQSLVNERSEVISPTKERHWLSPFIGDTLKVIGILALMAVAAIAVFKMPSSAPSVASNAENVINETYVNNIADVTPPLPEELPVVNAPTDVREYDQARSIYQEASDPFNQGVGNDVGGSPSNYAISNSGF
ncbi:hypothetical protein BH10PLA2_BH10PLA2_00190 [soil metagenome]